MSAPVSHDPLVVNTRDGVVWQRRAVTRDGHGLYAVTGSCSCPEYLMATLAELAEHGIAGSADVLPIPVGPAPVDPQAAVEQLDFLHRVTLPELRREVEHHEDGKARWRARAEKAEARVAELEAGLPVMHTALFKALDRVSELEAERHTTNEALDDAVQELRARRREPDDVTPQVRKLRVLLAGQRAVSFFQPGHTYAARANWPDGRERFRFRCESVTTDPESGEPRALGQHGRRTVDGGWAWSPNPRTFEDWRGGAWTDITEEADA